LPLNPPPAPFQSSEVPGYPFFISPVRDNLVLLYTQRDRQQNRNPEAGFNLRFEVRKLKGMEYNMVMENRLRRLPSVDKLLGEEQIKGLENIFPHDLVVEIIRENLDRYRTAIDKSQELPGLKEIIESITDQARSLQTKPPSYHKCHRCSPAY
jgi:hypothetical protein